MVLGNALTDADGEAHPMAGLLPLKTSFAERRMHLGYRNATLAADGPLGTAGDCYAAHEFHYATIVEQGAAGALFTATDAAGTDLGAMGLDVGHVMGSFIHLIDRR
jgi:cobyrinic acid a,c-diamide synthase